MRPGVAILIVLSAQACPAAGQEPAETGQAAANETAVETILDHPLSDEDYRDERSCLWRRQIDDIEIIDENLVVFRGRARNKVWVNKLSRPCGGLHRNMVVTTRTRGGSVCRLDTIDARSRSASPFDIPVRCRLGGFEAIDEVQVEAMKRAVDEHAKTGRKPDKAAGT